MVTKTDMSPVFMHQMKLHILQYVMHRQRWHPHHGCCIVMLESGKQNNADAVPDSPIGGGSS